MANPTTLTPVFSAFKPAAPATRHLWHVFRIDQAHKLETFLKGGLWMARLDTFSDPLEGTLPEQNLGLLNKLSKSQVPTILHEYRRAALNSFASCWHMHDNEPSQAAWKIFGDAGNGLAICTTPQRLAAALAPISGIDGPVHGPGGIRYIDHLTDEIPEANSLEAMFVVQQGYKDELEARILVLTLGTAAQNLDGIKGPFGDLIRRGGPKGHEIIGGHAGGKAIVPSVDPAALIVEIVIGPGVSLADRRQISSLVASYGLGGRVRQ